MMTRLQPGQPEGGSDVYGDAVCGGHWGAGARVVKREFSHQASKLLVYKVDGAQEMEPIIQQFRSRAHAPKNWRQGLVQTPAHHVHGSTVHSSQEGGAIPASVKGTRDKQMAYTHTLEHCSALKRSETPMQAAPQMNLEDITLSEVRQTSKSE